MPYDTFLVQDDIRICGIYYPALSVYIHVLLLIVTLYSHWLYEKKLTCSYLKV